MFSSFILSFGWSLGLKKIYKHTLTDCEGNNKASCEGHHLQLRYQNLLLCFPNCWSMFFCQVRICAHLLAYSKPISHFHKALLFHLTSEANSKQSVQLFEGQLHLGPIHPFVSYSLPALNMQVNEMLFLTRINSSSISNKLSILLRRHQGPPEETMAKQ